MENKYTIKVNFDGAEDLIVDILREDLLTHRSEYEERRHVMSYMDRLDHLHMENAMCTVLSFYTYAPEHEKWCDSVGIPK